ncbi:glycosyltransferase [Elusimicrobiota bacterium]
MKKILVIPHHPGLTNIKVRLVEIARTLSKENEVCLLHWNSAEGKYTIWERIKVSLKDIFKRPKIYREKRMTIAEIPTLHRPLWLVQKVNGFFLKRMIEKENFDLVINGSYYHFPITGKNRKYKYVFDIADFFTPDRENKHERFIAKKTKEEMLKADLITVISNEMVDYIKEKYDLKAYFVPNGADLVKMNSVSPEEIEELKIKYGIKNKWVMGYVGYIGGWVNVDMVIESFKQVKKSIPEAVLIWIGLAPDIEKVRREYGAEDIIFVGGVSNIEKYFRMLDVGLLAHRECDFQDKAFHLKVIEYTAARKYVVSTRLKETQRVGLPNIIFAAENADEWAKALNKAKNKKWDPQWDNIVKDYSWDNIIYNLLALIESN